MKSIWQNFRGLYSISKTLRFELRPQGRTLEHMQGQGYIQKDSDIDQAYQDTKEIVKDYHRWYINQRLLQFEFDVQKLYSLADCIKRIKKRSDLAVDDNLDKKALDETKNLLIKQVVDYFKTPSVDGNFLGHEKTFGADLFKATKKSGKQQAPIVDLILQKSSTEQAYQGDNQKNKLQAVKNFEKFATYFSGFNTNMSNIYGDKKGSIAFRLVDNFEKFLYNITIWQKVIDLGVLDKVPTTSQELQLYRASYFDIEGYNTCLTQQQIEDYNNALGGFSEREDTKKVQGLNEKINLFNQKIDDKSQKILKMKPLYKQILSIQDNQMSFRFETIENDSQLIQNIGQFLLAYNKEISSKQNNIFEFVSRLSGKENNIYLNNDTTGLTNLSQLAFDDWSYIKNRLQTKFEYDNNLEDIALNKTQE